MFFCNDKSLQDNCNNNTAVRDNKAKYKLRIIVNLDYVSIMFSINHSKKYQNNENQQPLIILSKVQLHIFIWGESYFEEKRYACMHIDDL